MNRIHFFVLFASILFNPLLSQNVVENRSASFKVLPLYEHLIPSLAKRAYTELKSVDLILKEYGSLNPDLIYLYLKNLEVKLNKNSSKNISYRDAITSIVNTSKRKRNSWVDSQIKKVYLNSASGYRIRKLIEFFVNYKSENINSTNEIDLSVVDKNEMSFYKLIYFSKQKNLEYNSNINYEKEVQSSVKGLIDKFNKANLNSDDIDRWELLDNINFYIFLFNNSYLDQYETTDFEAFEIVKKYAQREIIEFDFQLSFDYFPIDFEENITLNFEHYRSFFSEVINFKPKKEISFAATISLGLRFFLRQNPGLFSTVDFKAGLSTYHYTFNENRSLLVYNEKRYVTQVSYVEEQIRIDNFDTLNLFATNFQTTTSLFNFRKLNISAGLNCALFVGDTKVSGSYHGEINNFESNKRFSEIYKPKNSINPVIVTEYKILDYLDLRIEYLMMDNFRLGIKLLAPSFI